MKTITNLALSHDRRNKTRSILIMIVIMLTTVLLTAILLLSNGLINMEKQNADMEYGSYYGVYLSVTPKQIQEMERRSEFSQIGKAASVGLIDSESKVSLVAADETALQMMPVYDKLTEGRFPQNENEIAAQPEFFKSMGYHQITVGDTVLLPYRPDLTRPFEEREFVVSGLVEDQQTNLMTKFYTVYCSLAFYDAIANEDSRVYHAYFRLNEAVPITSDSVEDVLKELAKSCGIEERQVDTNKGYLIWNLDPGIEIISAAVMIAFVVIIFSVVVIYNIFQVGIVQKVQEYGKIKALGAANRQMKKLIYREGMFLAVFSIPAGLIAGYVVSVLCFGWLSKQGQTLRPDYITSDTSLFSLPLLLLSAFLAFVTVLLSLQKPKRIVAAISPVDAIRYQESTGKKRGGVRKGKKEVSIFSMAKANITASPRRTVSTICTMGLSCVLFVTLANCVGNMDEEYDARRQVEYGQFMIELDYSLNDEAYPENNLDFLVKNNPLNEELIAQIEALPGVTGVRTRRILAAKVNGENKSIKVFSQEEIERDKKNSKFIGDMGKEQASSEDSIYCGWYINMERSGYTVGQRLDVELQNGVESRAYEAELSGAFGSSDADWVISEEAYLQMNLSHDAIGNIWVDCKEEDNKQVRQELQELLQGKDHIEVITYEEMLNMAKSSTIMMKAACYMFLGILGLIGFMNMANTMIISIITRKQEYGILQAVGMTNRQMNQSLQIQGLIFTGGTVLLAVLIGLPAGYGIFRYGKWEGVFGLNVYHIPWVEIILMIVVIAALQLGLSFLLSRNLKRESLVERIRYQG